MKVAFSISFLPIIAAITLRIIQLNAAVTGLTADAPGSSWVGAQLQEHISQPSESQRVGLGLGETPWQCDRNTTRASPVCDQTQTHPLLPTKAEPASCLSRAITPARKDWTRSDLFPSRTQAEPEWLHLTSGDKVDQSKPSLAESYRRWQIYFLIMLHLESNSSHYRNAGLDSILRVKTVAEISVTFSM